MSEELALDPAAGAAPPAPDIERAPGPLWHLVAFLAASLGGALGIIGAGFQEAQAGPGLLIPFMGASVVAPIIEEGVKPLGVYMLLIRWPRLLRNQLYTALLCAFAGLAFGVIESLIYVYVYVSNPSGTFIVWRFSVTLFLHAAASFTVGLGINRGMLAWAKGEKPLPKASRNFYLAGVLLHSLYNTAVVALALTGIWDLE